MLGREKSGTWALPGKKAGREGHSVHRDKDQPYLGFRGTLVLKKTPLRRHQIININNQLFQMMIKYT